MRIESPFAAARRAALAGASAVVGGVLLAGCQALPGDTPGGAASGQPSPSASDAAEKFALPGSCADVGAAEIVGGQAPNGATFDEEAGEVEGVEGAEQLVCTWAGGTPASGSGSPEAASGGGSDPGNAGGGSGGTDARSPGGSNSGGLGGTDADSPGGSDSGTSDGSNGSGSGTGDGGSAGSGASAGEGRDAPEGAFALVFTVGTDPSDRAEVVQVPGTQQEMNWEVDVDVDVDSYRSGKADALGGELEYISTVEGSSKQLFLSLPGDFHVAAIASYSDAKKEDLEKVILTAAEKAKK